MTRVTLSYADVSCTFSVYVGQGGSYLRAGYGAPAFGGGGSPYVGGGYSAGGGGESVMTRFGGVEELLY